MSGRIVGPDGRRISAMPAAQWAGQMLQHPEADGCCAEAVPIEHAGFIYGVVTYHRNPDATVLATNEACGITGRAYTQLDADYPVTCSHFTHAWADRSFGSFFALPAGCSGHRDEEAWALPCGTIHNCATWWAPWNSCAYLWYGTVTVGGQTYNRRLFMTSESIIVWYPNHQTPSEEPYRSRCCPDADGTGNNRTMSANSSWKQACINKDPTGFGIEVGRVEVTCVINAEIDKPTLPRFGRFVNDYGCITKVRRVIEQQSVEGYSTTPGRGDADALLHNIGYIGGTENYTVVKEPNPAGDGGHSFGTPEVERQAWVSGMCRQERDDHWGGCAGWHWLEDHGTAPCASRWLADPGPPPRYSTGQCMFCVREEYWDQCNPVMQRQVEMHVGMVGSI